MMVWFMRWPRMYWWSLRESYRFVSYHDVSFWVRLPFKAAWITWATIRDRGC